MVLKTFINLCEDEINQLRDITLQLLDVSIPIKNSSSCEFRIVGFPDYSWGDLTSEGNIIQFKAIGVFDKSKERLDLLFDKKPMKIIEQYNKIIKFLQDYIYRDETVHRIHSIPPTKEEAIHRLQSQINELLALITMLKKFGNEETIIIPDTNALIKNRNFEFYGNILKQNKIIRDTWTVYITPTVITELDVLQHKKDRSPEFINKVKDALKYLKGIHKQGDPIKGIYRNQKQVKIQYLSDEPKSEKMSPWLNSNNYDDRILATCLDIQIKNPGSEVILMTADINFQTRAVSAFLSYIEPIIE